VLDEAACRVDGIRRQIEELVVADDRRVLAQHHHVVGSAIGFSAVERIELHHHAGGRGALLQRVLTSGVEQAVPDRDIAGLDVNRMVAQIVAVQHHACLADDDRLARDRDSRRQTRGDALEGRQAALQSYLECRLAHFDR
jgi:hypothetical protein